MIFTETLIFDLPCKLPHLFSQVSQARSFGPCLVNNTQLMLSHINVGTGKDATIRKMAETINKVVRCEGKLIFNTPKPDGVPRKFTEVARFTGIGWKYNTNLQDELKKTYDWYVHSRLI